MSNCIICKRLARDWQKTRHTVCIRTARYHLHWLQTTAKPREPKNVLHHVRCGDLFDRCRVTCAVTDWLAGELAVPRAPPRWGETLECQALEFPSGLILKQQLTQAPRRAATLPARAAKAMHSALRNRRGPFLVRRVYKERVKQKLAF